LHPCLTRVDLVDEDVGNSSAQARSIDRALIRVQSIRRHIDLKTLEPYVREMKPLAEQARDSRGGKERRDGDERRNVGACLISECQIAAAGRRRGVEGDASRSDRDLTVEAIDERRDDALLNP